MKGEAVLKVLLGGCAMAALVPNVVAMNAYAQEQDSEPVTVNEDESAGDEQATMESVVVTGSRIRRDVASTPAPVTTSMMSS